MTNRMKVIHCDGCGKPFLTTESLNAHRGNCVNYEPQD